MDKYLIPDRFATDPSESNAAKQWQHWKCTFENFLAELGADTQASEEKKLVDHIVDQLCGTISL